MPNTREKLIELVSQVQYLGGLEEKIADHLIANGVTLAEQLASSSKQLASSEWIPVTERLPEKDGEYLTCCSYDKWSQISILYFAKDGCDIWGGGFYGEENVFYYDYDGVYVSQDNVTHWMPLPEPPKGESK